VVARSAATSFVDVHLSRTSSSRPNCLVRNFLRIESPLSCEVNFKQSPVVACVLLVSGVGGFSTYLTGRSKLRVRKVG
jgi:hypothetical protein